MAPPPPSKAPTLQQEFGGLYAFAKDVTASSLTDGPKKDNLLRVSAKLERLAEREIASLHGRLDQMGDRGLALKPACSKGCWFCCTHVVMATVPEVLLLADHLRAKWTEEQLLSLRERIAKHKSALAPFRGGRSPTLPRIACPLLLDGECSAWSARPLVCRGWNSVSVEDCRNKMENPDSAKREQGFAPQVAVADFIRQGMSESLTAGGLNGDVCELALGLEIALDHPDAAERYASGEDVFEQARVGLEAWS